MFLSDKKPYISGEADHLPAEASLARDDGEEVRARDDARLLLRRRIGVNVARTNITDMYSQIIAKLRARQRRV